MHEGDEVVIRKPFDITEWPSWNPQMNDYIGKTFKLPAIQQYQGGAEGSQAYVTYEHFFFNLSWLHAAEVIPTDEGRYENEEAGVDY